MQGIPGIQVGSPEQQEKKQKDLQKEDVDRGRSEPGSNFIDIPLFVDEEKEKGQYFYVDIEISTSLKTAGKSDELGDTVNYSDIYKIVESIMKNKKYNLVEKVAESIAREILSRYVRIAMVKVAVMKPDPPIQGELEYVGVEIERSVSDY